MPVSPTITVKMTIVNNESFKDLNGNLHKLLICTFAPQCSYFSFGTPEEEELAFKTKNPSGLNEDALKYLIGADTTPAYGCVAHNDMTNTYYLTWNSDDDLIGTKFVVVCRGHDFSHSLSTNETLTEFINALALGSVELTFPIES